MGTKGAIVPPPIDCVDVGILSRLIKKLKCKQKTY